MEQDLGTVSEHFVEQDTFLFVFRLHKAQDIFLWYSQPLASYVNPVEVLQQSGLQQGEFFGAADGCPPVVHTEFAEDIFGVRSQGVE